MPVSTAAITARNRDNASHSTGPRTPERKAVSSQNARKHSFTVATHQILAIEDPLAYAAFEDEIISIYDPKSPREHLAAVDIAHCRWALRRFDEAELALLDTCLSNESQSPGEALGFQCITGPGEPVSPALTSLDLLYRYRRSWDHRHQQALREFNNARLDRNREERLTLAEERAAMLQGREAYKQTAQQQKQEDLQTNTARESQELGPSKRHPASTNRNSRHHKLASFRRPPYAHPNRYLHRKRKP